jgi:hypothetical protein
MESLIKERLSIQPLTLKKDGQSNKYSFSSTGIALTYTSIAMSSLFTGSQFKLKCTLNFRCGFILFIFHVTFSCVSQQRIHIGSVCYVN